MLLRLLLLLNALCLLVSSLPISRSFRHSRHRIKNSFKYRWRCTANHSDCTNAKHSFLSALNRISSELHIEIPVTIKVSFEPFPAELGNILGQARPGGFVQVESMGRTIDYPTALHKQIFGQEKAKRSPSDVDIIAQFNSNSKYWFKSSRKPIERDETDFEFAVAHEILHGLGVSTAWSEWGTTFTFQVNSDYLEPEVSENDGWKNMTIFDSFLFGTDGTSLNAIAEEIRVFEPPKGAEGQDIIDSFEASPQYAPAVEAYKLVAEQGLLFSGIHGPVKLFSEASSRALEPWIYVNIQVQNHSRPSTCSGVRAFFWNHSEF